LKKKLGGRWPKHGKKRKDPSGRKHANLNKEVGKED